MKRTYHEVTHERAAGVCLSSGVAAELGDLLTTSAVNATKKGYAAPDAIDKANEQLYTQMLRAGNRLAHTNADTARHSGSS